MKYVFPFFLCALFASCFSEGDCSISATNFMHIQFKKRRSLKEDTVITFAYKSVEIVGKSVALTYRPAASEILLPLDIDPSVSSTTFIFHRINADSSKQATDTIEIGYVMQSKVITKECGAYNFYKDLKILNTNLDSVQIKAFNKNLLKDPNSSATTAYALNYQIFY